MFHFRAAVFFSSYWVIALKFEFEEFYSSFIKLFIYSRRPVVRFLPRGPDETGCQEGWRVLSSRQVPDPAGTSDLSEQPLRTSWITLTHPQFHSQPSPAVSMLSGLRFTVQKCRLISQRSMWRCAAARPTTTQRCTATGALGGFSSGSNQMTWCIMCHPLCERKFLLSSRSDLCPLSGCWIPSSVRTTAAAGRTATVGMTTRPQDTQSSTKSAWTSTPWA